VRDELGEHGLGQRAASDARKDGAHEPPPEAGLAAGAAPAFLPSLARGRDVAPRRVRRGVDGLFFDGDAVARERLAVDALDRRLGPEQRVAGVEEDGPDLRGRRRARVQGITCPPSITTAWPVTFRASGDAR
jgi:hypothetical protein